MVSKMLLTLPFSFILCSKSGSWATWAMGNMLHKQWVRHTTKVSVAGLHWIYHAGANYNCIRELHVSLSW
jgi:hypothetical protein